MVDPSRAVGNGFAYQENLSSSKLTSVLEAVAGEYALVINGHSLVSAAVSPTGFSVLLSAPLDLGRTEVFAGTGGTPGSGSARGSKAGPP